MTNLSKFFQLSLSDKWLFFETLFLLLIIKIKIRAIPMRRYSSKIGKHGATTTQENTAGQEYIIFKVSRAIVRARKILHFKNRCYPEAIAAKILLRRRNLSSTLYIGVRKESDKVTAHAWLRCGNIYVTGKREMHKFAIVSTFA